ncbi:MAG TPA: DUF362 domain-containing protein [Blastocatellia bacterium]|nr:DUF362 domain-containing protein [Blastocatellia bacterium]
MNHQLERGEVAIVSGADHYPLHAPFDPPEVYPEHRDGQGAVDTSNAVYPMVREALSQLGLDVQNFGSLSWNPLGAVISPGDRVLIKPNLVLHFNAGGGPLDAVVTHPSIIRAIADYAMIALGGRGEIIIGDAPQMNCDFQSLCKESGLDVLADHLRKVCSLKGIAFHLLDLRQEQTIYKHGIIWKRLPLENEVNRPLRVQLGRESCMENIDFQRLYGADYARGETVRAHGDHRHEYVIASVALESDVVISVPKLKVHRKVGTTLNLKNMVGINTDKNHLAHYRIGSPADGGDECSVPRWEDRVERKLVDRFLGSGSATGRYAFLAWRAFRKVYSKLNGASAGEVFTYGNWKGNDTAWRMALDLNRILFFADSTGSLQSNPVRRYLSIVDGVVGGDGEGPLHPAAYRSGVVLAGFNPLSVDWVATRLMGFDPARVPMYANAIDQMKGWFPDFNPGRFTIRSNVASWANLISGDEIVFRFRASAGWRGAAEIYDVDSHGPGVPVEPLEAISQ